jgi:hypothetical protein
MPVFVRVPIIVKDPVVTQETGIALTEIVEISSEEVFLDGPLTPRVAVVDFDEKTGQVRAGVPFEPPADEDEKGFYRPVSTTVLPGEPLSREMSSVSVFGTVFKTIEMFEELDALGRPVVWGFDAPQLLVVPRAGEWANAFYERESHSLQFFYFRSSDGRTVHTSHSQDIVAHETAHAILDGVAPDLYNSISPQALAIHEAVADLTALLSAFRSRALSLQVLRQTGGSIRQSNAFTGIAGQVAEALQQNRPYLRELFNDRSLDPKAKRENRVDRGEPHSLSEVLSGALYGVMVRLHESLKAEYAVSAEPRPSLVEKAESDYEQRRQRLSDRSASIEIEDEYEPSAPPENESVALKALYVAANRLKRTLYRGLDYLPPGDVSFADLGRAILASDEASHPESGEQREWIQAEFVKRAMVENARDLSVRTNFRHPAVARLDLESLVDSDWAAYRFANENRAFLAIPQGVSFVVRRRLNVEKLYWYRGAPRKVRECLFKVSWNQVEANRVGRGLPKRRRITVGTTLAIDWSTGRIRALLTSARQKPEQRSDRNRLLAALVDGGILRVGEEAHGPDARPLQGAIRADVIEGVLRIQSAARLLHINPGGNS